MIEREGLIQGHRVVRCFIYCQWKWNLLCNAQIGKEYSNMHLPTWMSILCVWLSYLLHPMLVSRLLLLAPPNPPFYPFLVSNIQPYTLLLGVKCDGIKVATSFAQCFYPWLIRYHLQWTCSSLVWPNEREQSKAVLVFRFQPCQEITRHVSC